MSAAKEAVVVIIDVGETMSTPYADGTTPLEIALKAVNLLLQQKVCSFRCAALAETIKMLFSRKDEISVVLFGCEATDNPLYDGENYTNISVLQGKLAASLRLTEKDSLCRH
jgi:hypothetical protein